MNADNDYQSVPKHLEYRSYRLPVKEANHPQTSNVPSDLVDQLRHDIERLRNELHGTFKKLGSMTHPTVLHVSRALDQAVLVYHQHLEQNLEP